MSLISIIKNEDIVALYNRKLEAKEINEQDEYGNTSLHYAMATGNWYIIKFLLDRNANMLIENKEGLYPFQMAKQNSVKRICVETEMREKKTEQIELKDTNPDEVVKNMGFSSNTVRLKEGIENHSKIITDRLQKTKNKLSKILVNACNEKKCFNNADCLFECGHIVYCWKHGQDVQKCPKCGKKIEGSKYIIEPIV